MVQENQNDLTVRFYDSLTNDYHMLFEDWGKSISRQARILHRLIEDFSTQRSKRVLDCSCGIGTQALGLAQLAYEVYGTDLSPKAVERVKKEAIDRHISANFDVVDIRELKSKVEGTFDVVISCDNSLPHLLRDEDLLSAAQNILSKMTNDGIFIGSIRNYDAILKEKPTITRPVVNILKEEKVISFQTWDWVKSDTYIVNHFVLKGEEENYETTVRTTKYRAYRRDEISSIFRQGGFSFIKWLMEEDSNYYQPIMIATK